MAISIPSIFEVKGDDKLYFVTLDTYDKQRYDAIELNLATNEAAFVQKERDRHLEERNVDCFVADVKYGYSNDKKDAKLEAFVPDLKNRGWRVEKKTPEEIEVILAQQFLVEAKFKPTEGCVREGYVTTSKYIADIMDKATEAGRKRIYELGYQKLSEFLSTITGGAYEERFYELGNQIASIGNTVTNLQTDLNNAGRRNY